MDGFYVFEKISTVHFEPYDCELFGRAMSPTFLHVQYPLSDNYSWFVIWAAR